MKIYKISDFSDEMAFLKRIGFKVLENKEIGNYKLLLLKMGDEIPELGITSFDNPFTKFEDQQKIKSSQPSLKSGIKDVINEILNFKNKYGKILIASMNMAKSESYKNILEKSKLFNVSGMEYFPKSEDFNESWGFYIS
jgi:hypothetical protein